MLLDEQLSEELAIKEILLQGLKDNASVGSILSHTTNNTKLVYEGASKTMILLREVNSRISLIQANIQKLTMIGC